MANKSKKRIKHEQYVYIKKLERELKYLRANAVMYDPIVLINRDILLLLHSTVLMKRRCANMSSRRRAAKWLISL